MYLVSFFLLIFPQLAFANGETTSTIPEFQQAIVDNMTNRETPFTINYTGDAYALIPKLDDVITQAEQSDDYLSLSWKSINKSVTGITGDAHFTFTIDYFTTKAQEEYVDAKVTEIIASIITPEMNDFQKEQAIHDWVISNVSYDYTLAQRTAYTALTTGKTVCQGYSMLMYKMLNAVGIENKIVTGNIPSGYHAWNLVKINGNWYHVDSTNNTVRTDKTYFFNKTDDYMHENNFTWDIAKFPPAVSTYPPDTSTTVNVTGVSLDKTKIIVKVGESTTLVKTIMPTNATNQAVTWKSSNPLVATVDSNGKVAALKAGSATISVTTLDGNKVATCAVSVPNSLTGVTLSKTSATVNVGITLPLTAVITPSNATNKSITWVSDNPSVATVDTRGRVKGVSEGTATITATTVDGGYSATCAITVQTGVSKITLNLTKDTIKVGESHTLVATITPSNATNQAVDWKSSNPLVASVDASGKVVALKSGSAIISATTQDGKKIAKCSVTVPTVVTGVSLKITSATVNVGSMLALQTVITPSNATTKTVTWVSDSPLVAMVDASGRVKGISEGTARITATTTDGGYTATCDITVQTGISKISLNLTKDIIKVGESHTLVAIITPTNAALKSVTWKSSNPSVATVDENGKVVALKAGNTVITALTLDGKKSARCSVSVPVIVTGIALKSTSATVNIGATLSLSTVITPNNAANRSVTWVSDNPSVAAVDARGRVKGISEGTATITATTVDGGYTATCAITVQTGVSKISLNLTKTIINIGESETLVVAITPTNATLKEVAWESSNSSVATVNEEGKVVALKAGSTTITATTLDGKKSARCNVTVPTIVTGITLKTTDETLNIGAMVSLPTVITPSNASNKSVTWESDNPSVATVDASGRVKGVSEGTATMTAKTVDGGFTATCTITVQTGVSKISLNLSKTIIKVGESDTLVATITPTNATLKEVTWKSSNPSVATVDEEGKVVALKAGSTTITATTQDGKKSARCSVIVPVLVKGVTFDSSNVTVNVGATVSLPTVITPNNATNKSVTWESDDSSVATVDTRGRVKGLSEGTATITATTVDGGYTATCRITVNTGVTKISLNLTTTTIKVGESDTLVATITPTNATLQAVTWKSSNPTVATVDEDGKVVALKAGSTVISVITRDGNKVAKCNVIITE